MNNREQKTAQRAAYTGNIPNTPIGFSWYTAKPYIWFGLAGGSGVILAQMAGSLQPFLVGTFVDSLLNVDDIAGQLDVVYRWSFIFIFVFLIIYIG